MAIQDICMKGMYHWCCGSVPRRGNKHGIKAVRRWLTNDRKNTKYALKLDIKSFYANIPHDKLIDTIKRKIKDERALRLIIKIIKSTEEGLPIGNYTSQWLANLYLEGLDHYIKQDLKIKYYVRNIDDLVLFGRNKKSLHKARKAMFSYVENNLGLKIKKNWQLFLVDSRGVDFLGYVFFHEYTKLRDRNFLAIARQSRKIKKKIDSEKPIPFKMAAGMISRSGQFKYFSSQNVKRKYYDIIKTKKLKEVVRNESKRQLQAGKI